MRSYIIVVSARTPDRRNEIASLHSSHFGIQFDESSVPPKADQKPNSLGPFSIRFLDHPGTFTGLFCAPSLLFLTSICFLALFFGHRDLLVANPEELLETCGGRMPTVAILLLRAFTCFLFVPKN